MSRRIMFLLIIGIAFFNIKNTSALPVNTGNFTGAPTYVCPTPTCKCGDEVYFPPTCIDDRDCPFVSSPPQACCHVSCSNEKYCLRMIELKSTQIVETSPICGRSGDKNVVFLVDGATNENQDYHQAANELQEIKKFIKDVVEGGLGCSKFQISVMQFGGKHDARPVVSISEGSDTDVLLQGLDSMKQVKGSERRIGEALAAASNKLYEMETLRVIDETKRQIATPGVVVVIMRGKSLDVVEARDEISMMNLKKVRVLSLAIGPHADGLSSYLQKLSCSVSDVFTATYKELHQKVDDILGSICSDFGEICAADSLSCANKKYDIYIAVDGSFSMKHRVFENKKKLIMDLLVLLKSAGGSDNHVGLMQFSEIGKTKELLPLGNYSLSHAKAVVERMEFQNGKETMLGDALTRISKVFGWDAEGNRYTAVNKLVIFSDGGAQDLLKAKFEAEMLDRSVDVITVSVGGPGTAMEEIASIPNWSLKIELTSLTDSAKYANEISSLICRPSYTCRIGCASPA